MTGKLILLGVFVTCMFLMAYKSDKKKKVVFFGDSITQAGANPGGYIRLMDSIIQSEGNTQYELIGAGIGGDKIYDLYLRMEQDVMKHSPDIVVIYVGVNDVWHKASSGTGTDYVKFGRFYEAVVKKLQAAGSKVIICTPAVIGEKTDHSNQQDGDLNQYSNWIRGYAAKNELPLVDLRNHFMNYNMQHNPQNKEAGILTTDRVHLTHDGNLLVAEEMWKVIKTVK